MAGKHTNVLPQPRSGQVPSRPRSPAVLPAAMAAEGVAFAVLLGLDGSAWWRLARVSVTLAATVLAVRLTRRAGRTGRGATALVFGIAGTAAGLGMAGAHLAKAGLDVAAALAAVVLVAGVFLLIWGSAALVRAIPGWWRLLSAWYVPAHNGAAAVVLPGSGSTRTSVLPQAAVLARHGYGVLLVDGRGHGRSGGHAMDFGWWGGRDVPAAVSFLERQAGVRPGKIAGAAPGRRP